LLVLGEKKLSYHQQRSVKFKKPMAPIELAYRASWNSRTHNRNSERPSINNPAYDPGQDEEGVPMCAKGAESL
jgi:hypothetical protein